MLAIRDEQEFKPAVQKTGMGSIENLSEDPTKAFEQLMGLFTASGGRGDAFRKTFTSTYLKNKNDEDLRGEFLDFIIDANDPEINIAAKLASNKRAGLPPQINTDSVTQAGVRPHNAENLASTFKLALQEFLEDPDNPIKKKELVKASSSIYENIVIDYGLEPDRYNAEIVDMLGSV